MGILYARVNGASRKVIALYTRQGGQSRLVSTAWARVGGAGRNIHTIEATVFGNGAWSNISAGGISSLGSTGASSSMSAASSILLTARTNYTHIAGNIAAATEGTIDVTHYRTLQFDVDVSIHLGYSPSAYCIVCLTPNREAVRDFWTADGQQGYRFPSAAREWHYVHTADAFGISGTYTLDLTGLAGRYYLGFCAKSQYTDNGTTQLSVNNIKLVP